MKDKSLLKTIIICVVVSICTMAYVQINRYDYKPMPTGKVDWAGSNLYELARTDKLTGKVYFYDPIERSYR